MKISSFNKCSLVDIICRTAATTFMIVCCVIMSGCGNRNAVVTDYGNEQDAVSEDKNKEGTGQSNISVSVTGQNVREMLGAEKVDWSEEFEAGGLPIELAVKYTIPNLPSLDAFTGVRVADNEMVDFKGLTEGGTEEQVAKNLSGESTEAQVVKNVLGDSAKLVEELESGTPVEELVKGADDEEWLEFSNYYDAILNEFDPHNKYDVELGFTDEQTLRLKSMDTEDFYIHIYEGQFDGVPVRLIYGYSYTDKKQCIGFAPIYLSDYFQGEKEYVDSYEYGEVDFDVETIQDKMMEGKTNRCEMSDEALVGEAADLLQNKLSIPVYEDMLSLNSNDVYISGYGDDKTQMLFMTRKYWRTSDSDEVLCDGYKVYISQRLSGLFPATGMGPYLLNNSGSVVVTSRGILSAYVVRQMDITDVTDNVQLLNADRIRDSFKYVMQEQFDYSSLDHAGKKLFFNSLKLTYYPVDDPKNDMAFTYIPAWEFVGNMQNRPYVAVYINAIDGELIDVGY